MVREIRRQKGRREAVWCGTEKGSGGQGEERENGQQAASGLSLHPSLSILVNLGVGNGVESPRGPYGENCAWSGPGQAHKARIAF